jgi:chromosome partitioning protein
VDKNGVEYGLGEVLESASLRVCESGRGEFQVSSFKFQERPEREAVAHGAEHTALRRAIMRTRVEGLDLVPSRLDLAGVELERAGNRQEAGGSRQERLREALREIKGESAEQRADLRYDYIIIDAPPSLGLLTVNCLVAADSLIIPVQCEYFALEGLKQLREIVGRVREGLNPGLRIEGMLLTMYDGRTRLAVEVAEDMRRHFGNEVFRTVIPRSVRLAEAPSYGMPGVVYAAESAGAMAYMQLAEEIEERSR